MSIRRLLAFLLIVVVILVGVWLILTSLRTEDPCDDSMSQNYIRLVKKNMGFHSVYSIHYFDQIDAQVLIYPDVPEFDIEIVLNDLKNTGHINQTQYDCAIKQIG